MATLRKELGLGDVFSVAAGAMISSGLFVLPAIAFREVGAGVILSYIIASVIMIPSLMSKAELVTAMPQSGGTCFYVHRSLGSLWGLFSGFADWFSLALKSAFAILGMAIFLKLLFHHCFDTELSDLNIKLIAIAGIVLFGTLNILSVKQTGRFQTLLVVILFVLLALFVALGSQYIQVERYTNLTQKGWRTIFATAGLVFISYGGLTKVASIAGEVRNPGRNLPLGMFLAWLLVSCFYAGVICILVGVVAPDALANSFTPVSLAAEVFLGRPGFILLAVAAMAAFVTTANGGILAASRAPMAMSRDQLLPIQLSNIGKRFHTPYMSIAITCLFMIAAVSFLDLELLVKTASTLMLILFILDNTSVIVMRESGIHAYRPQFKAPMYPYLQAIAIVIYALIIVDMGIVPLIISGCFVVFSALWYWGFVAKRVTRASAIMHIVERVTDHELGKVTLENELRDILIERDNITHDRFDSLVKSCPILDIPNQQDSESLFREISKILSTRVGMEEMVLYEKFLHRESEGTTVIQPGLAIPHVVLEGNEIFDVLLVRAKEGIIFPDQEKPVHVMFVLVGTRDERNYHLRALMAIAHIVQEKDFETRWMQARDIESLRNLVLLSRRQRDTT